jgi:hypothetical protein
MKKINLTQIIAAKKNIIIRITAIALAAVTVTVAALEAKNMPAASLEANQSVAWYAANIPEAKAQNQVCHDNPEINSSQDCVNALHALEISFGVGKKS